MSPQELEKLNAWMSRVTACLVTGCAKPEQRIELLDSLDEFRAAANLERGANDPEAG